MLRALNIKEAKNKMANVKVKFIDTDKAKLRVNSTDVIKEESIALSNRLRSAFAMCKGKASGLSAIQLGIPKRACVVKFEDDVMVLFNPITVSTENEVENVEGCMSIPGKLFKVKRYNNVVVQAYNKKWEYVELRLEGTPAHIIQHEIDHMNGKLICDIGTPAE